MFNSLLYTGCPHHTKSKTSGCKSTSHIGRPISVLALTLLWQDRFLWLSSFWFKRQCVYFVGRFYQYTIFEYEIHFCIKVVEILTVTSCTLWFSRARHYCLGITTSKYLEGMEDTRQGFCRQKLYVILKIGVISYSDGRLPHIQFYYYFIILLRNK